VAEHLRFRDGGDYRRTVDIREPFGGVKYFAVLGDLYSEESLKEWINSTPEIDEIQSKITALEKQLQEQKEASTPIHCGFDGLELRSRSE